MVHTIHNLKQLLKNAGVVDTIVSPGAPAPESCEITTVQSDSRAVEPGCLFVAVRGYNVDGHDYIPDAVSRGAKVVVCEEFPSEPADGIVWVKVADSSVALGKIASAYYFEPSLNMVLIGVTGTNGKTTIATLLYDLARLDGRKAGLISTVVNKIDDLEIPSTHTTPDPLELNRLLAMMNDAGCEFVAMEVSSHSAAQHRIAGLHFDGGIFTNLTRDHLDYHKTFSAYRDAKKSFFDSLPRISFALTNDDDINGAFMLQNCPSRQKCTYGRHYSADYCVQVVEDRLDGMLLSFDGTEVETRFVGRFNASNLAAVYAAWQLAGYNSDNLLRHISMLTPVAGRFQPVRSADGVTAIVDYAHTPDALDNVLQTIREVVSDKASVITVCGCGGNRDRGKRPLMAQIAAKLSSRVILTSDNPRNEDPDAILAEMAAGLDEAQAARTLIISDRRQAIRTAVALAKPGDVILVAGKGHETYQIIGSETHHFDDREEVAAAFTARQQQ